MRKNYFTFKNLRQLCFALCLGVTVQAQTYTSWKVGSTTDVTTTTTGGMCLMGGGIDNDDAIKWMFQKAGGGDVVVLRSAGTDGYNTYMYSELGVPVNSVETIIIDTRAKASIAAIATKIRNAEALFISGGDQATYVSYWKDTPVEDAINYLINTKKVPVGGTSAGCAILGQFYYSAANTSIVSADALANPYATGVTIGVNDFLSSPYLANVITDTHYDNPDRRGRQTAFLARMWKDLGAGLNAKGIGVFEKTAVCIDQNGLARVFAPTTASFAYFYQIESNSTPETVVSGTPLTWNNAGKGVKIVKIPGNTAGSNTFDLNNWTTTSGSGISWGNIKVISGTLTETLGGTPPGGTPSCATPSGVTASAITNTSATISWTSTTATSYTVRYKTTAATAWTTLPNTTSTSSALTGLTLGTSYNVEVIGNCTSGASTAGTAQFITTGGTTVITYCASKGNSAATEWISKVVIGTINNTSGANGGYADFSAQSTSIAKGTATTLTLTPGFSATRSLYWKVYIDYNNNGLFTDSGEDVYGVFSSSTLTPSITVPASAVAGPIRMRVIVSYNAITSPCGTYNYGETEDYTLNVGGTTTPPATYCASKGNSATSEWISKVAIGTISNTSGKNGGYADFSAQSTTITKGTAATLTLTPGFSATRSLYWKVFVDYNNNGQFTDAGEEVYSVYSSSTLTPSITAPASAVTGAVRMRVIVSYNSITSPCGTYNYGETEDYTLNITTSAAKAIALKEAINEDTVVVENDATSKKIAVYPNPAREDFNIEFDSKKEDKVSIHIFSLSGNEEKNIEVKSEKGANRIRTTTNGLVPGHYIVKVIRSGEVLTSKMIISN
ncbi:GEVED domain-containing protein [Flavobacterium sp. 9R]|uniref:GEVED domain-containing protein n=1 Tax=Flavobacterium sp. 9R TaxID=2653143 RepID=UPI001357C7EB|nr:GEVED domain-containing protein [Flavobacterium sp. 9R]